MTSNMSMSSIRSKCKLLSQEENRGFTKNEPETRLKSNDLVWCNTETTNEEQ